MQKIVIATGNAAKAAELRALLKAQPGLASVEFLTPQDLEKYPPVVDESGETFAENARLKALAFAEEFGLPALADDSGLCVDALDNEPGVRSARWAGPTDADRNQALLERLRDVRNEERLAYFVCALCLAIPGGVTAEAEGECSGMILREPTGDGGFGYDPLFLIRKFGRSMAQLSPAQKNAVSHRARAVAALAPEIARLLGTSLRDSE